MTKNIINADFSKLELKVLANITKYETRDIHSEKAKEMFGENFTKEQRKIAKLQNYLELYHVDIKETFKK